MAKKRTKKQVKKTKKPVKRSKIRKVKNAMVKRTKHSFVRKAKLTTKSRVELATIRSLFAGLLNFLIWGLGYMYAGKTLYGFLWIITAICIMIPFTQILPMLPASITGYMSVGYFLVSVLLAWDAYSVEFRKIKFNLY